MGEEEKNEEMWKKKKISAGGVVGEGNEGLARRRRKRGRRGGKGRRGSQLFHLTDDNEPDNT